MEPIMILKPQDVVILLKLVVIRKADSAVAGPYFLTTKKYFFQKC